MNSRKAYKSFNKGYLSMDEWRKESIAISHRYLYCLINDKKFSYQRLRVINKFGKYANKSDYNTVCLTRDNETDRKKKERRIGSKKLRRTLKKEANLLINEDF